jgi:amidase
MVRQVLLETMATHDIEVLVYPTMACPASPIYTVEDDSSYVCSAADPYAAGYLANLSGFPDITVPMGYTEAGLPIGLSFMAEAYSEPKLLGFAYAYEQASTVRYSPTATPALPGETIEY